MALDAARAADPLQVIVPQCQLGIPIVLIMTAQHGAALQHLAVELDAFSSRGAVPEVPAKEVHTSVELMEFLNGATRAALLPALAQLAAEQVIVVLAFATPAPTPAGVGIANTSTWLHGGCMVVLKASSLLSPGSRPARAAACLGDCLLLQKGTSPRFTVINSPAQLRDPLRVLAEHLRRQPRYNPQRVYTRAVRVFRARSLLYGESI